MKKYLLSLLLSFTCISQAAEIKPLESVSLADMLNETQKQFDSMDSHLALAWWVPKEFWAVSAAQNQTTTVSQNDYVLQVIDKYMIFAVVQADITPIGSFSFYGKQEVFDGMKITLDGKDMLLTPSVDVDTEMKLLMETVKPMLQNFMGQLGENFHFYVYEDSQDDGSRLLSPYDKEQITINLKSRSKEVLSGTISTPLDSLHKARVCPNGEPAHISWQYCPWSGKKI